MLWNNTFTIVSFIICIFFFTLAFKGNSNGNVAHKGNEQVMCLIFNAFTEQQQTESWHEILVEPQ